MNFDQLYDDRAQPDKPIRMGIEEFGAARRSGSRRDGRLPSCRYRPGTESARVREWVIARAERSWFRIGDVPASPGVAAKVLCEMAARGDDVERVVKGIYWRRGADERSALAAARKDFLAMAFVGAGSGFAGLTAVCRAGWAWQAAAQDMIAVVGHCPAPAYPGVRFFSRRNQSREELTWAEITVVEAVRSSRLAQPKSKRWERESDASAASAAWVDALNSAESGQLAESLGWGAVLRPEAILETARQEVRQPRAFHQRIAELSERLPAAPAGVAAPSLPDPIPVLGAAA
ncbi:hypothetical protein [Candidatus Poriferisocius sp.]|uniref:hypothetical protein n=1 Tax=Candidatus Poriferisocius sp. TaxID=3101276 RepID=UPI003B02D7B8